MSELGTVSSLAEEPRILDVFEKELSRLGLVGETRNAKLLYLAFTSRLLPRPLSILVKGASSAGKNHLVASVAKFFPKEAVYALTSTSERALVYSPTDFKHRTLILYEGDGLIAGFMAYVVRSLLSEGRIAYETTVKQKNGNFTTQRIEKEGPTGLITTTTGLQIHDENETRMLSLSVNESGEQTTQILAAQAEAAVGIASTPPDLGCWRDLQTSLQQKQESIIVPWAPTLAKEIPPVAVRLRRDFPSLLSLIEAHALLHRATRERDAGRIVATLEDYEVVYTLAHDLLVEELTAAVPWAVRNTVEAVRGGARRVATIAKALGINKSTALRRVREAMELGYLESLEDRPGRPFQLVVVNEPPTEAEGVLPTPGELRGGPLHCCVIPGGIGQRPEAEVLFEVLAEIGWPALVYDRDETAGPGEDAWKSWARTASRQDVAAARRVAEATRNIQGVQK